MTALLAAVVGLLAGLHPATWGMYQEPPHEGCLHRSVGRRPLIGPRLGATLQPVTGLYPFKALFVPYKPCGRFVPRDLAIWASVVAAVIGAAHA